MTLHRLIHILCDKVRLAVISLAEKVGGVGIFCLSWQVVVTDSQKGENFPSRKLSQPN